MNLLKLYKKESKASGIPVIAMALISGIAQGLLLGIITIAAFTASYENLNFRYFLLFIITFAMVIVGKRYALREATMIIENIIQDIRIRIADKIRDTELIFLENIGKGEIYTRITRDTNLISEASVIIINACQQGIMVIFCILYVAVLSKLAFFITISSISVALFYLMYTYSPITEELRETAKKESIFFEMLDQIMDGFKELKVNKKKSDDFFTDLKKISDETKALKIRTGFRFVLRLMFSQTFFYILIAIIIFILPRMEYASGGLIIRITAAILFIMGPLNMVVGAIPLFEKSNIAVENLYGLEAQLDRASLFPNSLAKEGEKASVKVEKDENVTVKAIKTFEQIFLENTAFSYLDLYDIPLFSLGPVNLSIQKGETLFIVGGNGSGKSTFLKVLTGLYYPMSGNIRIDNFMINQLVYPAYRELFSVIFSDFHLFKRLYGLDTIDEDRINELLKIMELDKKTEVTERQFSNINLSTGQRKRLAMIVSLLDDKPIFVFDEWAADQDPEFRKYFYEELLKDLKNREKTIIVATHDDRYFHLADRVLKMEFGKFINEEIL